MAPSISRTSALAEEPDLHVLAAVPPPQQQMPQQQSAGAAEAERRTWPRARAERYRAAGSGRAGCRATERVPVPWQPDEGGEVGGDVGGADAVVGVVVAEEVGAGGVAHGVAETVVAAVAAAGVPAAPCDVAPVSGSVAAAAVAVACWMMYWLTDHPFGIPLR